jgi:hypothetical protein
MNYDDDVKKMSGKYEGRNKRSKDHCASIDVNEG